MNQLHQLLANAPLLALFVTIASGFFIGKFRIKRFVLGGIAGSLIMGVVIGQLNIKLPAELGTAFFALFIYAVGYQGGPQFFRSLNRRTLVQLFFASIICVLGLLCVLIFAWWFGLDRGTAAGLAAGGLTQSAIIGTAGDAIAKLTGVTHSQIQTMQSNVAVGYAVCYIFGSFGPILLLATIIPGIMGWDLRAEAKKLAKNQSNNQDQLEPGQFDAIHSLRTRVYQVGDNSPHIGQTAVSLFAGQNHIAIEALMRNGKQLEPTPQTTVMANDIIAITGDTANLVKYGHNIGTEITKPADLQLIEESRDVILTNKAIDGKSIAECDNPNNQQRFYGVFLRSISRLGEKLPANRDLKLKKGDEISLVGKPSDLDKIAAKIGYTLSKSPITDFIFFGLGLSLGILIGLIQFKLFGISIAIGTGGGCLFSGLLFGWLKSTHPRYASLPTGASNFLRDFGLAVFVATVGITAGPQAITTIKQYGFELFVLGIGVTIIPQIIAFFIGYYLLRIRNPIELLATIAGGRSANPGFAALLDKAGNSTPVLPFTVTYAIANIWLTLWGPIIIGIITKNYG